MKRRYTWPIFYLVSIILGNLMVISFGIVTICGITFPAGVLLVGMTFSFRDFVQRQWGSKWCWIWMLLATAITYFFNKDVAFASVVAFLVSEGVDWAAFTTLKMDFRKRVYLSNLLSCPLDSLLFVYLAFGWNWPAIWGQALVKYLSGLLILPLIPRKLENGKSSKNRNKKKRSSVHSNTEQNRG